MKPVSRMLPVPLGAALLTVLKDVGVSVISIERSGERELAASALPLSATDFEECGCEGMSVIALYFCRLLSLCVL